MTPVSILLLLGMVQYYLIGNVLIWSELSLYGAYASTPPK